MVSEIGQARQLRFSCHEEMVISGFMFTLELLLYVRREVRHSGQVRSG